MTFPDDVKFEPAYRGTGFGDDDWQRKANLWDIALEYQGRKFRTDYWMGAGLTQAKVLAGAKPTFGRDSRRVYPRVPTRDEVLGSLASDCSLGEQTFRDFCGDLGYDTDSRKALATWEACNNMVDDLRRLFGGDYQAFTEREWDT